MTPGASRGLLRQKRLYLSYLHEFAHLQTLPVAGLHLLWLLKNGRWRGDGQRKTWAMLAAAAINHEAVWELAREIYVIGQIEPEYAVFLTRWLVRSRPVAQGT